MGEEKFPEIEIFSTSGFLVRREGRGSWFLKLPVRAALAPLSGIGTSASPRKGKFPAN